MYIFFIRGLLHLHLLLRDSRHYTHAHSSDIHRVNVALTTAKAKAKAKASTIAHPASFFSPTSSSPLNPFLFRIVGRYRPELSFVHERVHAGDTTGGLTPVLQSDDASDERHGDALLATDSRAIIAQLRARG